MSPARKRLSSASACANASPWPTSSRSAVVRPAAMPSAYAASAACWTASRSGSGVAAGATLGDSRSSPSAPPSKSRNTLAPATGDPSGTRPSGPKASAPGGDTAGAGRSFSNEDIVRSPTRDHELAVGLEIADGGDDPLLRRLDVLQTGRAGRRQVLAQD